MGRRGLLYFYVLPLLGLLAAIMLAGVGPTLIQQVRTGRVLRDGVAAPARIIAIRDTGSRMNGQPVADIRVTVMPDGLPPYEASVRCIVTALNSLHFLPGGMLTVKYDPARPNRVAIAAAGALRVIKPQTLGLLTRPFEFKRRFHLGVAVIAFMPVGFTPTLLAEAAMWPFLAEELPADQPLDAAIPKAQGEFLTTAHAFAPGGRAVQSLRVGVQLGAIVKTLSVFGDRYLLGEDATAASPFTTMPVDWAHAYGGPGFAGNPGGKGAAPVDTPAGRLIPVPNVMDPRQARPRFPAGFGPLDQSWPDRAQCIGTYGDAWLKEDFPGFARDIDWRFFNTAPADQRFAGGLNGDESYAFENLHPEQKLLKGRLPGMAARLFLVRKNSPAFEEVGLRLTTVWFFPHRDRLVLVHHGQAALREEDGSDIERVVIGADQAGSLRPAAAFAAVMEKRLAPGGSAAILRDEDLVPAAWLEKAAGERDPSKLEDAINTMLARQHGRGARQMAEMRAKMRAEGLDPDAFGVEAMPALEPLPAAEDIPALAAAMQARADDARAKAEAALAAQEAAHETMLAAAGVSVEAMRAARTAKPKGPPGFTAAGMMAEQQAQVRAMHVLGIYHPALEAQIADPAIFAQWQKAETELRNGYRLMAHEQDPADGLAPDRSAAIRAMLAADTTAARAQYDLHGADLSWLDLAGVDLSGVCLDGADLRGTSLAGANLTHAVLAHARMAGCILDGADLSGANLGRAGLTRASLRGSVLREAVLTGADLTDAWLVGADLTGADLSEVILAGAHLGQVRAAGILAMKLSLAGLAAPGIVLDGAKFIECDLQRVDFTGGSLHKTVFIACNLDGACMAGARLANAVFVQGCTLAGADLSAADLTEANLRETRLPGASLVGAIMERADCSGGVLAGARLGRVRGAGSRFIAADLAGASLAGANLMQADLARADLRGADLSAVGVYEANMARVQLDPATKVAGMMTKRMRYLPRYQPPPGPADDA